MTQIISALRRDRFTLQVADRLVTTEKGRQFDDLANKSIIYWARDAIVSMAYTGSAFVGNIPTDSWIALKLCGEDPPGRRNLLEGWMRYGKIPSMDIGQAIRLLEKELKLSEIATQNANFTLVIVGWKWKCGNHVPVGRRGPLLMGCRIHKPYGGRFAIQYLPRYWQWETNSKFIADPDGNMSTVEFEELCDSIRNITVNNRRTPIEQRLRMYEQAIVDAIRAVSARNQYVGQNCMSILLAPPHHRAFVRVTFFPHKHYSARDLGVATAPPEYLAAFTPWIIGQNFVWSPQINVGGSCVLRMGPFQVHLEGFEGGSIGGKSMSGLHGQRRPPRRI
jgi:hypothetical protein